MDGRNHGKFHTNNIIGDKNSGRSTRNRPNGIATFTAQDAEEQQVPYKILGKAMMELLKISHTIEEMADRRRRPQEAKNDKRDNTISLEQD